MMGELVSSGPPSCPRCGGFIAPGDQTVDGMHPECVHQRRQDEAKGGIWGPVVVGWTIIVLAALTALWELF